RSLSAAHAHPASLVRAVDGAAHRARRRARLAHFGRAGAAWLSTPFRLARTRRLARSSGPAGCRTRGGLAGPGGPFRPTLSLSEKSEKQGFDPRKSSANIRKFLR